MEALAGSDLRESLARLYLRVYRTKTPVVRELVDRYRPTPADEERVAFYLGDNQAGACIDVSHPKVRSSIVKRYRTDLLNAEELLSRFKSGKLSGAYSLPILNSCRLLDGAGYARPFLHIWGDNRKRFWPGGAFAKTRLANDRTLTLLKLNPIRHFRHLSAPSLAGGIPFSRKQNMVVWRGANTGWLQNGRLRFSVVARYGSKPCFDVGFHKVQENLLGSDVPHEYVKPRLTIHEQLRNKFLLSIEGNDVSSGLKWMLASSSIVLMAEPKVDSWLMESRLRPYEHYLPLAEDYCDIEDQMDWALSHEAECEEIIRNANGYMRQFLDPVRESFLEREVFRRHLANVTVVGGEGFSEPMIDR